MLLVHLGIAINNVRLIVQGKILILLLFIHTFTLDGQWINWTRYHELQN